MGLGIKVTLGAKITILTADCRMKGNSSPSGLCSGHTLTNQGQTPSVITKHCPVGGQCYQVIFEVQVKEVSPLTNQSVPRLTISQSSGKPRSRCYSQPPSSSSPIILLPQNFETLATQELEIPFVWGLQCLLVRNRSAMVLAPLLQNFVTDNDMHSP